MVHHTKFRRSADRQQSLPPTHHTIQRPVAPFRLLREQTDCRDTLCQQLYNSHCSQSADLHTGSGERLYPRRPAHPPQCPCRTCTGWFKERCICHQQQQIHQTIRRKTTIQDCNFPERHVRIKDKLLFRTDTNASLHRDGIRVRSLFFLRRCSKNSILL